MVFVKVHIPLRVFKNWIFNHFLLFRVNTILIYIHHNKNKTFNWQRLLVFYIKYVFKQAAQYTSYRKWTVTEMMAISICLAFIRTHALSPHTALEVFWGWAACYRGGGWFMASLTRSDWAFCSDTEQRPLSPWGHLALSLSPSLPHTVCEPKQNLYYICNKHHPLLKHNIPLFIFLQTSHFITDHTFLCLQRIYVTQIHIRMTLNESCLPVNQTWFPE